MTDVRDEVFELLVKLGVDRELIVDGATIKDDLGIDSTELVEVVVAAENQYSIRIGQEDYSECQTVDDLVACVADRVSVEAGVEG